MGVVQDLAGKTKSAVCLKKTIMQLLSVFFDYYVFTSNTHVPKGVII